jgi:hypothetical protein
MSVKEEIIALDYMREQMHREDSELVLIKLQAFCLATSIFIACYSNLFVEQQKRKAS